MKYWKEMTIKLSDFATVVPGYHLARNHIFVETENIYLIYDSSRCETECEAYSYSLPISEQYFTREEDIIVNTAKLKDIVLIEKDKEGLLVSDRYLIIRCNRNKAIPGFVCNEMTSESLCEKRKKICRDAVLPHQKAKKYADLKIKLPSLEMQEIMYIIQKKLDEFSAELNRRIANDSRTDNDNLIK